MPMIRNGHKIISTNTLPSVLLRDLPIYPQFVQTFFAIFIASLLCFVNRLLIIKYGFSETSQKKGHVTEIDQSTGK